MERKDRVDTFGAVSLIAFSALLAFNQVVIAVVNEGLQPVFFAGVRSAGAAVCLVLWFWVRGRPLGLERKNLRAGTVRGTLFAAEFILLFWSLDLTTVSRASINFYTMPLWFALMAHFLIPGERLNVLRVEMRGAFIHEQNFRLTIKRTRQKNALLLPARKRRAHVADERFILHRHAHDVLVD